MLIKNILNYIETHDISMSDLAKKCGVKTSTITNIIYGYTKSPTLDVVTKLAKGMDMTIDELTKGDKKESDEIKKIYEKMQGLDDNEKAQIYAMMRGAIEATKNFKE